MLAVRLVIGVLSYAASTPGGLFALMLVTGTGIGLLVARVGEALLPDLTSSGPALDRRGAAGHGQLCLNAVVAQTQTVIVRDEHYSIPKRSLAERAFSRFWTLPALFIAMSFAAGLLVPQIDFLLRSEDGPAFPGGPDGARSLLSTISSAMISVTSLVFSITMVVMQLASSQFTPRVLNTYLSNRVTQYTLGVFVGSFVYSLTVLREVRGGFDGEPAFVPQIAVFGAYLLVLTAVVLFIAFIHQVTSMIQVSRVISVLGDQTTALITKVFSPPDADRAMGTWVTQGDPVLIRAVGGHGHVVEIDEKKLVKFAHSQDLRIALLVSPGDFAAEGHPLAQVWGEPDDASSTINTAVAMRADRSTAQDPTFGVRQLVDIAERALSPGLNDPTTAIQVLNELERILREIVSRQSPTGYLTDDDGTVRVHRPLPTVMGVVRLGLEEISHYGESSLRIPRAVERILNELGRVCLPEHADDLDRLRIELLERGRD